MAEFKIKKEKFDILLNLIAKTDNEELQNAFLDYQNEKNENNEGYLNYLKRVCDGGASIQEKAALPLQNVSQRSELLVAFCDYMAKEGGNGFIDKHSLVEGFLKATNCG